MRSQVTGLAFTAAIAPLAIAQEAPPVAAPQEVVRQPVAVAPQIMWAPQVLNISRMPTLGDLVLAKVDAGRDGTQVIMMIESFRTEKTTAMVTKMIPEKRERTMEVDGKKVTVPFTVHVRVTEEREIDQKVPAGPKPFKMDAEEIRFFNLDAEEMSVDEAGKILTSLRPVFLIDQNTNDPLQLPEICQRALHGDCLIAVTEEKVRQTHNSTLPVLAPIGAPQLPAVRMLPVQPPQPAQPLQAVEPGPRTQP